MFDDLFDEIDFGISGPRSKRAATFLRIVFGALGTFLAGAGLWLMLAGDKFAKAGLPFRLAGANVFLFLGLFCALNVACTNAGAGQVSASLRASRCCSSCELCSARSRSDHSTIHQRVPALGRHAAMHADAAERIDFPAREPASDEAELGDIGLLAFGDRQLGLHKHERFDERLFAGDEIRQIRIVAALAPRQPGLGGAHRERRARGFLHHGEDLLECRGYQMHERVGICQRPSHALETEQCLPALANRGVAGAQVFQMRRGHAASLYHGRPAGTARALADAARFLRAAERGPRGAFAASWEQQRAALFFDSLAAASGYTRAACRN